MDYISGWCKSQRKLEGITAIVTGSNTGIGKETALDFYLRGARVIMACRDTTKAEAAKKGMELGNLDHPTGSLVVEKLDLSSLKSVRQFASLVLARESAVHILVNNAGVMCCPEGRTEDGFETHIGTNHFGHALLTLLLLPRLINSASSRIVIVSSYLHANSNLDLDDVNFENTLYDPFKAYCRSKCANVLFTRALAKKLKEHNINDVTTYCLHPGVINTDIGRHFSDTVWFGATWLFRNILGWFTKSPRCGAQTTIYCAVDETCVDQSGLYYSECAVSSTSKFCKNDAAVDKFWDLTMKLLHLENYNPFGTLDPNERYLL